MENLGFLTGISRYIFNTPTTNESRLPPVMIPRNLQDPRNTRLDKRMETLFNPYGSKARIFPKSTMVNTRDVNYKFGKE